MLTQNEADQLRTMSKRLLPGQEVLLPEAGQSKMFKLESPDRKHKFLLDANRRGVITLSRCTYQQRCRVVVILTRLDVGGPPHRNPRVEAPPLEFLMPHNGAEVSCPHVHLYVAGFEDKWAVPAGDVGLENTDDLAQVLIDFMKYCGVEEIPPTQQRPLL